MTAFSVRCNPASGAALPQLAWCALMATFPTAPYERGTVDIPSNVHAENGLVEIDRNFLSTGRAFLRGSVLNEARCNGTSDPEQCNAALALCDRRGLDCFVGRQPGLSRLWR